MDAVIARMPLKERLLFKVMPAASRKQLEASAQQKANRKNRACQTDHTLLEVDFLPVFLAENESVHRICVEHDARLESHQRRNSKNGAKQ